MHCIDLNCDMGEGFGAYRMGNDAEILNYVTSANIACGFHAGDASTMHRTVRMAHAKGVVIGANPGLPDLQGFGRRAMHLSAAEAYDMVVYQIGALTGFAQTLGARVHHVKAHGALYNTAAKDQVLASAIAQAVYDVDRTLVLYGLAGSLMLVAAEKVGLRTASEVFADRSYQDDGSLTPRSNANAMIDDVELAIAQVMRFVQEGLVRSVNGNDVPVRADTLCIHGDQPNAQIFARKIVAALKQNNIQVEAFR